MVNLKEKEPKKEQEIQEEKVERKSEKLETPEKKEREVEVESVVEKIEKTREKREKKKKEIEGESVGDQPAVTVPVSEKEIEIGKNMGVVESLRWLVTEVLRKVKIAKREGKRIVFGGESKNE